MNQSADVKRSYESPLRKAQAAATRGAIIDAASALFIERGYVATSIEAVAEAAGVSRATVFTSGRGQEGAAQDGLRRRPRRRRRAGSRSRCGRLAGGQAEPIRGAS